MESVHYSSNPIYVSVSNTKVFFFWNWLGANIIFHPIGFTVLRTRPICAPAPISRIYISLNFTQKHAIYRKTHTWWEQLSHNQTIISRKKKTAQPCDTRTYTCYTFSYIYIHSVRSRTEMHPEKILLLRIRYTTDSISYSLPPRTTMNARLLLLSLFFPGAIFLYFFFLFRQPFFSPARDFSRRIDRRIRIASESKHQRAGPMNRCARIVWWYRGKKKKHQSSSPPKRALYFPGDYSSTIFFPHSPALAEKIKPRPGKHSLPYKNLIVRKKCVRVCIYTGCIRFNCA